MMKRKKNEKLLPENIEFNAPDVTLFVKDYIPDNFEVKRHKYFRRRILEHLSPVGFHRAVHDAFNSDFLDKVIDADDESLIAEIDSERSSHIVALDTLADKHLSELEKVVGNIRALEARRADLSAELDALRSQSVKTAELK